MLYYIVLQQYAQTINAAKKHFKKELDSDGKLVKKFINRIEGYINFIGQVRGRNERVYMRLNSDFQKEFQPN